VKRERGEGEICAAIFMSMGAGGALGVNHGHQQKKKYHEDQNHVDRR